KVTILCAAASFTKSLIDIAGASTVEGVYGVFPTVGWDDNVPGLVKATEYVKKNNPKDYGNMDYLTTWSTTLMVAEILRLALQNTPPDVLMKGNVESWRAVEKNGIQKLKDFNPGGLHGPVTYTPGDNRLAKSLKLHVIRAGKIQPISDWITTPLIKYEDFPWFTTR
ncbi:MAG: ABC transporter substrate-binding protein, partial [Dehalococcoidia bacterium]|nr:ABC transporter substrate-binding protein [Dehalococcoidia bacterium]